MPVFLINSGLFNALSGFERSFIKPGLINREIPVIVKYMPTPQKINHFAIIAGFIGFLNQKYSQRIEQIGNRNFRKISSRLNRILIFLITGFFRLPERIRIYSFNIKSIYCNVAIAIIFNLKSQNSINQGRPRIPIISKIRVGLSILFHLI